MEVQRGKARGKEIFFISSKIFLAQAGAFVYNI